MKHKLNIKHNCNISNIQAIYCSISVLAYNKKYNES